MKHRKRADDGGGTYNPKRRLRDWQGTEEDVAFGKSLVKKIKYVGSAAHKRNPGDFNLSPPSAPRQNATLCDSANVLNKSMAETLIKSGASKGLVDCRTENNFPKLIWAVSPDDIVFEAQLGNSGLGEYHGYPMPLSDPMRPVILRANKAR